MQIHGKTYTEVKDRIAKLYSKDRVFSDSYLVTEMFAHAPDMSWVVFRATLYVNETPEDKRYFTGWAFEGQSQDSKEVNFSSWVENCETSAIGRALANANIGVSEDGTRPSQEEMNKVNRWKENPKPTPASTSVPTRAPIKKIGAIAPSLSTKAEYVKTLLGLKEELKDVTGHDQAFQQMLENHKITNLADATETTLEAMVQGFGPYVLSVGDFKKENVPNWQDTAKKMTLLL
jgi:hypothetical protein